MKTKYCIFFVLLLSSCFNNSNDIIEIKTKNNIENNIENNEENNEESKKEEKIIEKEIDELIESILGNWENFNF